MVIKLSGRLVYGVLVAALAGAAAWYAFGEGLSPGRRDRAAVSFPVLKGNAESQVSRPAEPVGSGAISGAQNPVPAVEQKPDERLSALLDKEVNKVAEVDFGKIPREGYAIKIENSERFREAVLATIRTEVFPSDGSYDPPKEDIQCARDLVVSLLLAYGEQGIDEFAAVWDAYEINTGGKHARALVDKMQEMSPMYVWRKVDLELSSLRFFRLPDSQVPPELLRGFPTGLKDGVAQGKSFRVLDVSLHAVTEEGSLEHLRFLFSVEEDGRIGFAGHIAYGGFRPRDGSGLPRLIQVQPKAPGSN